MRRILSTLALLFVPLIAPSKSWGFALLGPLDTRYQTDVIGYNSFNTDLGGPMNRHEEYRWNVPNITYGFDQSFIDYFGPDGIAAIEAAIKILNDVPAASDLTDDVLRQYPTDVKRINFRASALGVLDLKTYALGMLVEEIGLASAERYVYTLRDRRVLNNIPQYLVIQRNFDPFTWEYTPYVNDTLYTYRIFQIRDPEAYDAIEFAVDPLAFTFTSVSSVTGAIFGSGSLFAGANPGEYYTGLTRDDVGGIRYLYRANNINAENLLPGTTNSAPIPTGPFESPFSTIGGGPFPRSPWDNPFGFTNVFFTNVVTITNFPGPGVTNVVVDTAYRPGIDKLKFIRMQNSFFPGLFQPFTNTYVDTYIDTNTTTLRAQQVERVTTRPDILFRADDIGLSTGGFPTLLARTTAAGWDRNNDINFPGAPPQAGPGVITPFIDITFSTIGPFRLNFDTQPFLSGTDVTEAGASAFSFQAVWGSFDGTTNAPILYPAGRLRIEDLERQMFGN